MLVAYQNQLQALIQAPNSPTPLIPSATQTSYINTARLQLAADAECCRASGTLALVAATPGYAFSSIVLPPLGAVASVLAVRSAQLSGLPIEVRPYEWYQAYYLGASGTGTPTLMAQLGQGSFGTLQFAPIPTGTGSVILDCVCLPILLVDDSTAEAIPALWRDAVPFYAAWLAMQSLQRQPDAEAMLRRYMMLARRGRQLATPSQLPENLPGGIGTQMAGSHTVLGQPPAPAGG